jgi:hypothetical protein
MDLDAIMTVLARPNNNCKSKTHSLVAEDSAHQQLRNSLRVIYIWSWAYDVCLTLKQTGRLTVVHIKTLTLLLSLGDIPEAAVRHVGCRCEIVASL